MQIDISRMKNSLLTLAEIGALPAGGITRLALSDEDKAARNLVTDWMRQADLRITVDEMGNIFARRDGVMADAPPVIMGSHLDTVIVGGKFDGALGIMGALEVVRTLHDNQVKTINPVEIGIFTNEEGTRFQPAMMASGVLAGEIPLGVAYSALDRSGRSFQEELNRIGYMGETGCVPRQIKAYLEFHIEQGPVLESRNISIGIVEGIVGITWLNVKIIGESDHAGPTPMARRKDALVSAGEIIASISKIPEEVGEGTVATVGFMNIHPNVINVIPGVVNFSVDIRSGDDEKISRVKKLLKDKAEKVCLEKGTGLEITELWQTSPVDFSEEIIETIREICEKLNYPVHRMTSGAGHDAGYMSKIARTGMIFVPSKKGKSHCPEEDTEWMDIEKGTTVLLQTVLDLAGMENS